MYPKDELLTEIYCTKQCLEGFPSSVLKNLPAMQATWTQSLGQEDPWEEGAAVHSSIFAWRIPWTEKPTRLQSMGSQRAGHDWNDRTGT